MIINVPLIERWRDAWRLHSVQAAGAIVVIGAIRETAQHLVDSVPELAWVAHAPWFPPTMIFLGLAVAVLRVVPQPKVTSPSTPDPDVAAPPAATELPAVPVVPTVPAAPAAPDFQAALQAAILSLGIEDMSPLWQKITLGIPKLVIDAEAAFKNTPGSGADKAATVTSIVAAALPATESSDGMAKAQAIMQMAVMFFNAVHPMFQKQGATTITNAFPGTPQ